MNVSISQLQQMPEGQTFECKSVIVDPKALAITIVAMANADGGLIAIGISDKTRTIEGVDYDEKHLNEILRTPLDFCVPSVAVSIEYLPCTDINGKDNHILLIGVPASTRLHANQADEVYWRVGDKSRKISFEERLRLMYDKGERYYEDEPISSSTIDDIDLDVVAAFVKRIGYGKSPSEYLHENKWLLTNGDETPHASVACILLFGKRPWNFYPRARIRFIRYAGIEERVGREMNVVKDVTFEGRILDQVQKCVEYIETQVKEHSYLGESGTFTTDREYPKFVIQEMVVNSVCHRDYSIKGTEIQVKMFDDRLVFETPGKLPGMVRIDNIRHTHFSRNPKIASYLKAYDYVKEFGEGVDRMCRELASIGVEEPKYHTVSFITKATIYAHHIGESKTIGQEKGHKEGHDLGHKKSGKPDEIREKRGHKNLRELDKKGQEKGHEKENEISGNPDYQRGERGHEKGQEKGHEKVLSIIEENPRISMVELSKRCGLSVKATRNILNKLRSDHIIVRVGPNNGGCWKIAE